MKKLFLLCIFFLAFFTLKSQDLMNLQPTGYVNDYENIFTPEQKADLEKICSDYEKKTSIEICVATSADFNMQLSDDLGNKWKIGKKGLNNGLLIVLSKSQRHCSIKPGYGLEPLLPDATIKRFTNDIFPRTLSNDLFYDGIKELILTCQNKIGSQNYDFLVKYKELKEKERKQANKDGFHTFLLGLLFLIILGLIGYLIYLWYKKNQEFLKLKNDILVLLKNIELLRNQIDNELPENLKLVYDNRVQKLTNKLVTRETRLQIQNIYNQIFDYKKLINTIDSSVASIQRSESDIQKYLQDNYPYCEKYLKDELNSIVPTNLDIGGEYTIQRMTKLMGIQNMIEGKLKTFLNKTVKINNILKDKETINQKIEELKKSYIEYVEKRTILSSVKIGERYNALVSIDFDNYISKISVSMTDSFNSLNNGDFDSALSYYGNCITTIAISNSAFFTVKLLLADYIKSDKYIKDNQYKIAEVMSEIDNKINKSGVSYSRKSTYENIKSNITIYKNLINYDVISAYDLLVKIIKDLAYLASDIRSDISSNNSYSTPAYTPSPFVSINDDNNYSGNNDNGNGGNDFEGFGGGEFGGGGVDTNF